MRHQVLCNSCGKHCTGELEELQIECPSCGEVGCEDCEQSGYFTLKECPRKFVGSMVEAINIATFAERGCFPVDGGLLNQSCSFLELVAVLENETIRLANEQTERAVNG